MASCKRACRAALAPLAALILLAPAPALARPADAHRSSAAVQAPTLAPGVWGTAPLSGELSPNGSFTLTAPVASVTTGNTFYDVFLHRTLGGTITLVGRAPALPSRPGQAKVMSVPVTVYVAGRSASLPVTVRGFSTGRGTWLRAYTAVGLARYGIKSATGGPAGSLRVAINAYFPDR